MRERAREGKVGSEWEEERRRFFEDRGWEIREMERKREEANGWFGELIRKDKEEQRLERERRIGDSRYNRWYKVIKEKGIPEYLRKG